MRAISGLTEPTSVIAQLESDSEQLSYLQRRTIMLRRASGAIALAAGLSLGASSASENQSLKVATATTTTVAVGLGGISHFERQSSLRKGRDFATNALETLPFVDDDEIDQSLPDPHSILSEYAPAVTGVAGYYFGENMQNLDRPLTAVATLIGVAGLSAQAINESTTSDRLDSYRAAVNRAIANHHRSVDRRHLTIVNLPLGEDIENEPPHLSE